MRASNPTLLRTAKTCTRIFQIVLLGGFDGLKRVRYLQENVSQSYTDIYSFQILSEIVLPISFKTLNQKTIDTSCYEDTVQSGGRI
jgi:hypothetical protein